jgi:ABC-type dipeptide/oligopeptide/nickel transport system permease subunit
MKKLQAAARALARLHHFLGGSLWNDLALVVVLVFVIVGVFAPWLAPLDPNFQNLAARLEPPLTEGHVLGTDRLGRDVLSRLILGSRVSLLIGAVAILLSVAVGVIYGLISGYFGGKWDSVLMRVVDAWLAFPFLLLAIVIVAVLGPGLWNLVIALALTGWVVYARLVRGEVLSLRERAFVSAARQLGVSHHRIMIGHILPNVFAPVLVVATLELGIIIVMEASLSFLGLGVEAARPTWGGMLADGRAFIDRAWWLATFPGLAIFVLVLAINVLGDSLRDALDPRWERAGKKGGVVVES